MLGIKRVVIGDGERGLLYKNRRFERVLAPGVYRLWAAAIHLDRSRVSPRPSTFKYADEIRDEPFQVRCVVFDHREEASRR